MISRDKQLPDLTKAMNDKKTRKTYFILRPGYDIVSKPW